MEARPEVPGLCTGPYGAKLRGGEGGVTLGVVSDGPDTEQLSRAITMHVADPPLPQFGCPGIPFRRE